ncbi:MAG: type II secretion system F family protein [Sedimentisphaerales bacterium]|nr:type II secretion system F family protein [Sedimentisphaerales bacterium]
MRMRKMRQRLGIGEEADSELGTLRLWHEIHREDDADHAEGPKKFSVRDYFRRLRYEAGWTTSVQTVFLKLFGMAGVLFMVVYALGGGALLAIGVSGGAIALFCMHTQSRISKHTTLFEKQLVDALGIAARALRAGHPLVGAFQLVAEEIDEPQGPIFAQICQEQSLGRDMKDSIRRVADTTYNTELKLFATSVAIQLSSGGNLADLMDSLASVIRARMKLNRRVRVLTSQTQLSKRILIALPVLLFVALNVLDPDYMAVFYTTTIGQLMLAGTVGIMSIGYWVMNRLSVLRY